MKSKKVVFWVVTAVVLIADRITKELAGGIPAGGITLIPGVLGLNEGEEARMKKTTICFARDPSLDQIEVVIRAPERNAAVEALIQRITDRAQETLTVFDRDGVKLTLTGEIEDRGQAFIQLKTIVENMTDKTVIPGNTDKEAG